MTEIEKTDLEQVENTEPTQDAPETAVDEPAADTARETPAPAEDVSETTQAAANAEQSPQETVEEIPLDQSVEGEIGDPDHAEESPEAAKKAATKSLDDVAYVENEADTADCADEIGVSGIYDAYGREIIPDVFENRLRLSKNAVKLAYSKLKNTLLSYSGVKRSFSGKSEIFTVGEEVVVKFGIEGDALVLTYDKTHRLSVKKEKGGESIKKALEIITAKADALGLKKIPSYAGTAYAERYPFNPDAVLRGHEEEPPEGDYSGRDYDYIEGELTKDIIEELMGEDFNLEEKKGKERLEALRQQASTIKGAVALTEPIVHFFNVARDSENNVGYVTVQQVLNDKFLGKILPQQFFAIAEASERIETLNTVSVEATAAAADENPTLTFVTQASARLLTKDKSLDRLKKAAKTENGNLVLAFDCALLDALGDKGLAAVRDIAGAGIKIMIDNTENAGLRVLTEYPVEYLRFDGRYYVDEDEKKTAHLDMILGYAKVQGIKTAALYVDTIKQARYFLAHGVQNIEGDVVGQPVRIVQNAVKEAKKLPVKGGQ